MRISRDLQCGKIVRLYAVYVCDFNAGCFSRPDISVSFPRNGALMVCELRPFRFCNMIYLGEKSCCPYLISR